MITSILVANRGEIARRVFRTARAMGMRCVAVYVDADADAPFVGEADVSVRLPDNYLDGSAIIAAAQAAGADAIHPGYGFLSENAGFAQAVRDAGLVWVGPSPTVIETMGDKLAAKDAAVAAGVPTLPSTTNPSNANAIGYPLLVKASAGGGGKGMRIVASAAELDESVAAAKREALSGFGDDTVFLERYVAKSRHVEIQILGDQHGGLVHLGERECSIQRRHQKIIEESPSPVVSGQMRADMGDAAIALGNAIGYQSAGTVEFLVDDATNEFYFLEVNTRLQVEHPVTEEVTGVDLVREQLRVAAGEELGYGQDAITFTGHAIEARLYAEDPANDFLPQIGTVEVFEPAADPPVRWDTGVETGSVVGVDFDPMLAKVVAHGPTRAEAAGRLALALERLHFGGVITNRDFLAATLRSDAFVAGDTTTDFIDRIAPNPQLHLNNAELQGTAIAAAMWLQGRNRANAPVLASMPSGFRIGRLPPQSITFQQGERLVSVSYQRQRNGTFAVESLVSPVDPDALGAQSQGEASASVAVVKNWADTHVDIDINGLRHRARVSANANADIVHVQSPRGTVTLHVLPRFELPGAEINTGGLVAPMPGVVLDVRCQPGQAVNAGDTLVVLEAMKMEHHMDAPADGVVAEVRVSNGSQVANGELLIVFEDQTDA